LVWMSMGYYCRCNCCICNFIIPPKPPGGIQA
jgi:hypothetical protein